MKLSKGQGAQEVQTCITNKQKSLQIILQVNKTSRINLTTKKPNSYVCFQITDSRRREVTGPIFNAIAFTLFSRSFACICVSAVFGHNKHPLICGDGGGGVVWT